MATTFATVTSTAQRLALGFPCLVPAAPHREFVAKAATTLPISASAFNLQYLLDNFTPDESSPEYLPHELVVSQGDSANAVFQIQSARVLFGTSESRRIPRT